MDNALTSILSDSDHSDNKRVFISKNIITFPFLENQLPAAGMNQLFFLYFHLLGHLIEPNLDFYMNFIH